MGDRIEALIEVEGKSTVRVRIGGEDLEISRASAAALDLSLGLEVGAALRDRLHEAADRRAAAARVLRWLRGRPRTAHEVRRYLRGRGHAVPVVEAILEDLERQGLVDDERYAAWFVQARLAHRPAGAARLMRELGERGVPAELAQAAVRGQVQSQDELQLALAAARSRLAQVRRLGREQGLRRLAAFLAQRGFTEEVVRSVCLQVLGTDEPAKAPALLRRATDPERLDLEPEEP